MPKSKVNKENIYIICIKELTEKKARKYFKNHKFKILDDFVPLLFVVTCNIKEANKLKIRRPEWLVSIATNNPVFKLCKN
jgi:hypothetical protein